MDSPLVFPNCDGSILGSMSLIIGSDTSASRILDKFLVPEIFLNSSVVFVGNALGTGVTNSYFQSCGQTPDRTAVLYKCDRG